MRQRKGREIERQREHRHINWRSSRCGSQRERERERESTEKEEESRVFWRIGEEVGVGEGGGWWGVGKGGRDKGNRRYQASEALCTNKLISSKAARS